MTFAKALVCGLLEDNGRVLFLIERGKDDVKRLVLPCALVGGGEDVVSVLVDAFRKQAGIDVEVLGIAFEAGWNAGSRRRRERVACLAYRVRAKVARCMPGKGFTGFTWVSLDEAKRARLARKAEWLRMV